MKCGVASGDLGAGGLGFVMAPAFSVNLPSPHHPRGLFLRCRPYRIGAS